MEQVLQSVQSGFGSAYQWLRVFFAPLATILFPYSIIVRGQEHVFVTANRITVARTAAVFPVFYLLRIGHHKSAFVLFVTAAVLDFVDGLVATIHRRQYAEHKIIMRPVDLDGHLGAFLDAFCDKLFWLVGLWSVYLMSVRDVSHWSLRIVFFVECAVLFSLEFRLAVVRVQDFFYNKKPGDGERDLRATSAGKFKYTLQCVGLGGFIFAYPAPLTHWAGIVGLICFALAIPFARRSLAQKLQQRSEVR